MAQRAGYRTEAWIPALNLGLAMELWDLFMEKELSPAADGNAASRSMRPRGAPALNAAKMNLQAKFRKRGCLGSEDFVGLFR